MKNHFFRMLAGFICVAVLALCAAAAPAEGKYTVFLGQPFPDFTAADTEGNSFTLSAALEDHEAVLINFWATWCIPCRQEFPFLTEACGKFGGRVALIALSADPRDTMEKVAEFREENGLSFPMGLDVGLELYNYIHGFGYPATVIVDRFGNAVFYHDCAFNSAEDVERVLETFLGDGYTESKVLERVPRDASTRAFPVSAARALYPEGGNCRKVLFRSETAENSFTCWIVPDGSAAMRAEVTAEDDVGAMMYWDSYRLEGVYLKDMLDPEEGVYTRRQPMPPPDDKNRYVQVQLYNGYEEEASEDDVTVYLVKDEGGIESLADSLKSRGYGEITWEYADAEAPAENAPQAYIIHVADQDNNPVEDAIVNFCTDQACVPKESDENGAVAFAGAPDVYHVQIADLPDGYSWDEEYGMYTTREYGEWVLRVRKN